MHLKKSSAKWWPFCPGGDELNWKGYAAHWPENRLRYILRVTFFVTIGRNLSEFSARFTPNRDQLRTRTELRVLDFLDSSAIVKHLSSDIKLALTSMSGSDWHTSKQKLYNWPSNKSELRPHHDRFAISWPSHAIRKLFSINSGPRNTTTVRSPWYTCDRPPTDLWYFATN